MGISGNLTLLLILLLNCSVSNKTILSAYEPAHRSLLGVGGGEQVSPSSKSGIKSISYTFKRVGEAEYITI